MGQLQKPPSRSCYANGGVPHRAFRQSHVNRNDNPTTHRKVHVFNMFLTANDIIFQCASFGNLNILSRGKPFPSHMLALVSHDPTFDVTYLPCTPFSSRAGWVAFRELRRLQDFYLSVQFLGSSITIFRRHPRGENFDCIAKEVDSH